MANFKHVYLILFSLYWAQGLPVGFMTHALPVILRSEGVSLAHIGGFGLLMLPWSIKVFWAPLVDRYGSTRFGHYRSWIVPTQILSICTLITLSFIPIESLNQPIYLFCFFIVLLMMNLVGSTQDIATDGLAVNVLQSTQQQWGNTFQVIGSRLGFIVGGGVVLWLLDGLQWQQTFLCLAGLVALNTLPILFNKEPVHTQKKVSTLPQQSSSWLGAIRSYLVYFKSSPILLSWLWVLISFKVADGLSGPLLKPLMVDLGLTYTQIGIYITMFGAMAALFGAGVAGFSLKFISRVHALIIFSILKILSLLAYSWLAFQYEANVTVSFTVIYAINAAEDMVSAMLLVVMLTLVMQYCRKHFAGTDFTFQVAIMATVSGGLYSVSGVVADYLGYAKYMAIISIVASIMLYPILNWAKKIESAKP